MPPSANSPATSARTIFQGPASPGATLKTLEALLDSPGLVRLRVAVAYARWDGLGLMSLKLESFLSRGGSFELLVGIENGVTTPDILLYGLVLQKRFPGRVVVRTIKDQYANSIMHTKFYEFRFSSLTTCIIGSANLTGGGLLRNAEMSIAHSTPKGTELEKQWDAVWLELKSHSNPLTGPQARQLLLSGRAGDEKDKAAETRCRSKPYLSVGIRPAPKPLFSSILGLKDNKQKNEILAGLDSLTERPDVLYLQILQYETGGSQGKPGYQVQLPVATLGAYFGVGKSQTRKVRFRFSSGNLDVNLTHFENNTHRVRLRPIRDVPRPAVLKFVRIADDDYTVEIIPAHRYAAVLKSKCDQQRQAKARRWGLE